MAAAGVLTLPTEAHALQPIEEFFEKSKTRSFEAREQDATTRQRDWEVDAALGRLLPSFTARGVYQRNQYEVAVQMPGSTESIVITPQNQFDAFFQLDVPLVDVASHHRHAQAKHVRSAAEAQGEVVRADVQRAVARAYYSFIGASALVESAEKSLAMAEDNERFVRVRHEAGVALELDLERARTNVERTRQDLADARLLRATAARSLETLSGITPSAVTEFPEDDLRGEGSLSEWLAAKNTPSDRVQSHLNDAAHAGRRAAAAALLPTLSVNAQERITNASGFSGRSDAYTLQAVLSWKLDYATYATAEAQAAASDVQEIRSERARRNVEDSIFDAFQRVEAGIAKSSSARAQAAAAQKAAELASDRYRAGALTQLDVTQSQRDAFQAEAARIQADADLAYARVLLRTSAGRPPVDRRTRTLTPRPATTPPAERAPLPDAPAPSPKSL